MQRCSSEAGVKDCPLHHPEEQWLCCFARIGKDTPKQKGKAGESIVRADSTLDLLPPCFLPCPGEDTLIFNCLASEESISQVLMLFCCSKRNASNSFGLGSILIALVAFMHEWDQQQA
ncbi:hypothetical protein V6N13_004614 [Hibiscus sabdariffa]|uniref:Uncharacterized protein n=1 Tax=Hibiscus sabdariffa TaxID=183260 RepID=A0ABR2RZ15_9ROSI